MTFNNVPTNGWPQIKDLEKLDAIASQIENMPTFTSDDKAFLEDLPAYPDTDGTKMLTATTTEGNTSLSYEDIPETGGADYSTTEHKTGQKWIDGKDIYEITYPLIVGGVAQYTRGGMENKSYLVGLTGFDIAYISGFIGVRSTAIDSYPIGNTMYFTFDRANGAIFIAHDTFTYTDLYVTVQYTKSTVSTNNKNKGGK